MQHYYLVTSHNQAKFLAPAIDSIKNQYRALPEFEETARVLILDDASRDDTDAVLARLTKQFSNIAAQKLEPSGVIGKNRNLLLDWYTASPRDTDGFVMFLDGDDLLTPGHLKAKLRMFQAQPELDCVGGQVRLFYEGPTLPHTVRTFSTDPETQAIANIFECHFYVSNAMFRRKVFDNPAVRFPETKTSEDWLFFAQHQLNKRHSDAVTLLYRRHTWNVTNLPQENGYVASVRKAARTVELLKMGMVPTERACEILDLVSYLSFQVSDTWAQGHAVSTYHNENRMPWFSYLRERPGVVANWSEHRKEIVALFAQMLDSNDRVRAHPPVKLRKFLDAILAAADQEALHALSWAGAPALVLDAP